LAARANTRNTRTRRSLREALKAFNKAVESGKSVEISKAQNAAFSIIDTAAKKAVIHKNKAARQKARLAAAAKKAGAKPVKATVKPAAKKPATKKPKAKKTQ